MLHFTRRTLPVLFTLIVISLLPGTALSQPLPKGVTKITAVEGITEYRLDNGLKVLLFADASKPTITVNMTYLVGSRHENYGETGMAHLLEHLLFKGTPSIPKIDEEFNRRGMRMNGTTSFDRTNYYEQFQASEDNLRWAIGMEADRMVNSNIAKKDLDSEMTVVRNEMENGENSPGSVLFNRMQSVAFDWHNYAHSPIGNRSDVENVKIENLQAFYRRYYQPDNAVLLIAGKFDNAKTLQWIATAFKSVRKPSRTLPAFWTVEPSQDGERSFVVRRKGDVQFIALGYKIPASLHPDSDAIEFASEILGDTPNGRLHKQLVQTGLATQVFAFGRNGFNPGLQLVGAVVKLGEPLEPVRDALIAATESFAKTPPTKEELDRVKRSFSNQFEKSLNDHESVGLALSEYIALGDWRLFFQSRDSVDMMSTERVVQAASAYFRRDNRVAGSFIPEDQPQRASIPTAPTAVTVLKDFQAKTRTDVAEVFDPSPTNIDARTLRSKIGGLDVALLAKKNRGETVSVAINLRWGNEQALFGKRAVARLTAGMLMRGNQKYTREELADAFDRLKMSGSVYQFDTTKANLAQAIQLAAQVMQQPNFPPAAFQELVKETLVSIESTRSDPAALAGQALAQHFNLYPKGDWRAAETIDETIANIKAVTLDDVKAFHKYFYGASRGELSVIGDFDPVETNKVIKAAFGDWSSALPYQRLSERFVEVEPIRKEINTPDKENGSYLAAMNLPLRDDDPDYPALMIANYLFGGGAGLNSRLMERVRQKDGLSYGIRSNLQASAIDRSGSFSISAIAAPQNLAKVVAAVKEEIDKVRQEGFTAQEVARAKSGYSQQRVQARSQDPALASAWNFALYLERTFAWSKARDEQVAALTVEQVNAAFRKAIDPAKLTVITAGDAAKAKAVQK